MEPTQLYETAIYNRDRGQAFRFLTVPARALVEREIPSEVDELADALGFKPIRGPEGRPARRIAPVEAWSLPFVIDAALGRFPDFPFEFYFDPLEPMRPRREPSPFAQYVTYVPVIPFESSPLGAKSLAELATASGSVGAAVGYSATGDLLVLLLVPAGIIVCGAARGIGDALRIGLRSKLLRLMGVDDPERNDPPAEG